MLKTESWDPNREPCNYGGLAYLVNYDGVGAIISPILTRFLFAEEQTAKPVEIAGVDASF